MQLKITPMELFLVTLMYKKLLTAVETKQIQNFEIIYKN
jgi:hypothetical protein